MSKEIDLIVFDYAGEEQHVYSAPNKDPFIKSLAGVYLGSGTENKQQASFLALLAEPQALTANAELASTYKVHLVRATTDTPVSVNATVDQIICCGMI